MTPDVVVYKIGDKTFIVFPKRDYYVVYEMDNTEERVGKFDSIEKFEEFTKTVEFKKKWML